MVGVLVRKGIGVFYKAVNPNLTDFYSGNYQYKVGKGDSNRELKKDQSIECGKGWHWTSYERAVAFAGSKPHTIISAVIKLKDILSVYNKVRVKAFHNVQIVKFKELPFKE